MKKAYTFDDVALIPQYNNVPSRLIPTLQTQLTTNRKIDIPLVASNMDTVIGEELADILIQEGSVPIFHRFCSLDQQKYFVKKYREKCFVSCGFKNMEDLEILFDLGAAGVCIDVAHGHSQVMIEFIEKIKKKYPDKEIIAGNVCTPMAYHDLVSAGADAVKVGIGPGAACTTRLVTGFGMPQFSAIYECAEIARKLQVPLIADGGIRDSRDVVLALAAGASCVMVGKLFALTKESAAPKRSSSESPNHLEAKYRGQASKDFQNEFYGSVKKKTVEEGVDFWEEVSGSAIQLIDKLLGGVRSGLTYGGARDISELQRKAEFRHVTSTYLSESAPRQKIDQKQFLKMAAAPAKES